MADEIWEWISGYEGLYSVSTLGRVRSERSNKLLSLTPNYAGYLVVGLSKDGVSTQFRVNRLVAEAFLPNPNALPQVNHINERKDDNRVENLEWCTAAYNCNYGMHGARISKSRREKCHDGYMVKVKKTSDLEWTDYKSIRQACEATGERREKLRYKHRKTGMNVVYLNGYIYWLHPGESLCL